MRIELDPQFAQEVLDKIAVREFSDRSGTHATDLIFCLNKQALRKLRNPKPTDEEILLFSLGWSTQRWLSGSFEPDTVIIKDGIQLSLDSIIVPSEGGKMPQPWELKATYQSSTRDIHENIHWIRQVMGYCCAINSTTAKLTRLSIMGDWKWVFKPKGFKDWSEEEQETFKLAHSRPTLQAWKLEFTQEELDKFWEWMKARRDAYEDILKTGRLVPSVCALASGQEWECKFCNYQEECNHTIE